MLNRSQVWSLHVISQCSLDSRPAVLLHFDSQRYLFNCGEATQRIFSEQRTGLRNLRNILFTRMHWSNCGGLPGMILTLADSKLQNLNDGDGADKTREGKQIKEHMSHLNLFGTDKVERFFNTCQTFIKRDNLALKFFDVSTDSAASNCTFKDENVMIDALVLTQSQVCDEIKKRPLEVEVNDLEPVEQDKVDMSDCSIAYIVTCNDYKRKFNAKLADELGIPKGKIRASIINGQTVTLDNGRIIEPEEVTDPPIPGHSVLVVEFPTVKHITSFTEQYDSKKYKKLSVAVYFLGKGVSKSQEFISMVDKINEEYGGEVEHLLFDSDRVSSELVFKDIAHQQMRFNGTGLSSPYFKISVPRIGNDTIDTANAKNVIYVRPGSHVEFKGKSKQSTFVQLENNDQETCEQNQPESKDIITFLGTGGMIPSKLRNVSATLVNVDSTNVLLDCGEGTIGQILRIFGPETTESILKDLKCIYISHMHADHHLGTMGLVREWLKCNQNNQNHLMICGPKQLKRFLNNCNYLDMIYPYDMRQRIQVVDNSDLIRQPLRISNGVQMQTCRVDHCSNSYGVSLFNEGVVPKQILYSGDTRPCEALIQLKQIHDTAETYLIHEATFTSDLQHEAKSRKHSTVKEASQIATEMNAHMLLLTHFSQRMRPDELITDTSASFSGCIQQGHYDILSNQEELTLCKIPVILTCDGMQIKI